MVGEYMEPFIDASIDVLSATTGLIPEVGVTYQKIKVKNIDNIAVRIGLLGKVQGTFTMIFESGLACRIASLMMGGFPVPSLDDIAMSAVAELVNMISGHAAGFFGKSNIDMHITPPAVITIEELKEYTDVSVTMCVPFTFENGEFLELAIAI